MARLTKKLFQAFQEEAVKAVVDEQTGAIPKLKGGIFTKEDILAIRDERVRQKVQARYDAYVEAAAKFNSVRNEMSKAKYELQNSLNWPFMKLQLITKSFFWTVMGLDKLGNIIYRDNDRNYRETYTSRQVARGNRSLNAKPRGDAWDKAWDMSDEDSQELDNQDNQDIEDTEDNQYTPEQAVAHLRNLGANDQPDAFREMSDELKRAIWPLLSNTERTKFYNIWHP